MLSSLEHDRARLITLIRTHAYREREVVLSSGQKSNFYVDMKEVSLRAEGHMLIGRLIFAEIEALARAEGADVAGVGGLTLGADPIASATSLTAALAGRPLHAFIVRKEPKAHGTSAYIEGLAALGPNARVVVVEDVFTTGGSASKAVDRCRAAGLDVRAIIAVVDREEGGREALATLGTTVVSLVGRSEIAPASAG